MADDIVKLKEKAKIEAGKNKKMKNPKVRKYFNIGRRFVLTLALFVLIFAAASIVKIQAAGNVTGWLWGGTEDADLVPPAQMGVIDGNETGVGLISMTGANYGVNVPSTNDPVTGYAWMNAGGNPDNGLQNGIGWIDFNPQDHCTTGTPGPGQYQAASCDLSSDPGLNCGKGVVRRTGINLQGCARIVSIAQATVNSNSGGWQGWVKLKGTAQNGSEYGVTINSDGTFCKPGVATTYLVNGRNECYAWSSELGWIDFSRAKTCTNPGCATKQLCEGSTFSSCDSSFCTEGGTCTLNADQKSWICSNSCGSVSCSAFIQPRVDGSCGTADGGSFCQGGTPSNEELCSAGTPVPSAASLDLDVYEVSWQCQGICGGANEDCSAKGKKACGWIETNP